jgi:hypothetical protein
MMAELSASRRDVDNASDGCDLWPMDDTVRK